METAARIVVISVTRLDDLLPLGLLLEATTVSFLAEIGSFRVSFWQNGLLKKFLEWPKVYWLAFGPFFQKLGDFLLTRSGHTDRSKLWILRAQCEQR